MGVVIGKMDGQVEKIFLGNNLTKILKDKDLSEEEKSVFWQQRRKSRKTILFCRRFL